MASHIECRFNKISLLQCYFIAILRAGYIIFDEEFSNFTGDLISVSSTKIGSVTPVIRYLPQHSYTDSTYIVLLVKVVPVSLKIFPILIILGPFYD